MPKPPEYRIIYNWDGAPHGYTPVPQTLDDFVARTYAPLQDTQVGALFWCIGEHAVRWSSDEMELLGDVHGRRYESAAAYTHTENIRQMLERGENPHQALIDRGHELGLHVYGSLRMNDNHFNGAQLADLSTLHHTELTHLRREHPEWLLGADTADWFALSWNMAVPEVRENRFRHLRELCENFAWDGVELDWQRHPFHFPDDHGYRLRYVLTDFMRAARQLADDIGRQRGKPLYLAARVAGSIEGCDRIGYDIATWTRERLVDILIPAGAAGTDPAIEVEAFLPLCAANDIALYPGFDGGVPGPAASPEPEAMRTKGTALNYHRQGATGIYAFNWHADRDSKRELLTQVGASDTLRSRDKLYNVTHRFRVTSGDWRGAYQHDRLRGQLPVALHRALAGGGPEFVLELGDDLDSDPPTRVVLRLRLQDWIAGDEIRVLWDGKPVALDIAYDFGNDPAPIADVSAATWHSCELAPLQAQQGAHQIAVSLVARHPQLACDLVLTDIEVLVRY
jgi:hypothetical protein